MIPKKTIPAVSLLPPGSVLEGVLLPRYDRERRLTGSLKARVMTLIDPEHIEGGEVTIQLFNPDGGQRGRIDLVKALFDQAKGTLEATEPVGIVSDRFTATGSGLVYAFEQGEGFLTGPSTTRIHHPPPTVMTAPRVPSFRISALLGAAMLPLAAAPPEPFTSEETAALEKDAASRSERLIEANQAARSDLRADLAASAEAIEAARQFLVQADLLDTPTSGESLPEPKPLDTKHDPLDTVVDADGGTYFDNDEGVLVYFNNVRVADPRFTLRGAKELKIFFGKKPAAEAGESEDDDGSRGFNLGGGNLGDVERIVATGEVRIVQKPADGKPPVEASGAIFSYNVKTGQIILNGGFPWVTHGANSFRATTANGILRINRSGEFSFDGPSQTGLQLGDLERR